MPNLPRTHPVKKCVTGLTCSQLDQHIPALNLHRIYANLVPQWPSRTRLRIPSPAVPGTDHLPALNHSPPKRPPAMQADIIHGADLAVDIGDAHSLFTARKFFGFVRKGQLGFGCAPGRHTRA